jgi:tRNA A-37 threonylcarbamoyl transferase component Bud32
VDPDETVHTDMPALCADGPSGTLVADRYVLLDRLGSGGAAVVHEAYDTRLDRGVALKLLREDSTEPRERQRFISEARLLGSLSHHPHLVQVLDAGVDGDRPFLALELVRGRTLVDELADGVDADRLAAIGADLAEALAHVHAAGIVHRDLKPGNVLVAADGSVKLADFGIARLVDDTRRQTRTGCLVGTVAYLAPEQVAGELATTAVDVYALGLVLLEALTGTRAYAGTSVESALARLSRQPDVPESLPPGWRALLQAMTTRDPAARPTAEQVATGLRAIDARSPAPAPATVQVRVAPASKGRAKGRAEGRAEGRAAVRGRMVLAGLAAAFVLLVGVAAAPSLSELPRRDHSAAVSRGQQQAAAERRTSDLAEAQPTADAQVAAAVVAPAPPPHRAHKAKHHARPARHHARHHGGHHAKPPKHKLPHKPGKPGKPGKHGAKHHH